MKQNQKLPSYRSDLEIAGGKVGVLLIHSLGGNPIEMRFVAQALARNGCTVHAPLLHGLAGGTDVLGLSAWTDWCEAVEKAHARLREKCDVVIVGGMSAGGMLALNLAAEKPSEVDAVVLFAPTLWPNGWAIPWYFNFFRLVRHDFTARRFRFQQRAPFGIKDERIRNFVIDSMKTDERTLDDVFSRNGATVFQFKRLVKKVRSKLGEIRQPTIIFHPRHDDQSDLSNAMTLQRKLGGLVEMCVLDDSYHMVTLDRQRSFVVDRTIDFVTRQTERIANAEAVARLVRKKPPFSAAE